MVLVAGSVMMLVSRWVVSERWETVDGAELCDGVISGWWDEQEVGTTAMEHADRRKLVCVRWEGLTRQ